MKKKRIIAILVLALLASPFVEGISAQKVKVKTTKKGIILNGIKFHKQKKREWCGPAVLRTVLYMNGINEKQKQIAEATFNKKEKVVKLSEMVFYPREKGLKSYSFKGDLDVLKDFLSRGIPVVVFQKVSKEVDKGHFRLVIGYEEDLIVFQDPLLGKALRAKEKDFLELWNFKGEERWAEVVVKNDSLVKEEYKESEVFYRDMARALFRRGNFEESLCYWEKALRKAESSIYLYSLAFTLLKAGAFREAEEYAQQAFKKEPANPFCLDVLAEIEYETGNYEKALDLIHEARKLSEREYFKKKYEAWIMKIREKQK